MVTKLKNCALVVPSSLIQWVPVRLSFFLDLQYVSMFCDHLIGSVMFVFLALCTYGQFNLVLKSVKYAYFATTQQIQ